MKKKLAIAFALAVAMTGAIVIAVSQNRDPLHAKARRDWKEKAIRELAQRSADSNWLASEVRTLNTKPAETARGWDGWFSPQMILMKNGEWIVYANKCRKEDSRIHDIFLGRGSNGKWYYSTYHFCIGMIAMMESEQPESLTRFMETYYLRDFDGRSDECLKKTWPPKRR